MLKYFSPLFMFLAIAEFANAAAPAEPQSPKIADAREAFTEPGGFDYRYDSPALLRDKTQTDPLLEARKRAEHKSTKASADGVEKKPQFDYQTVVSPIDRVEGGSYTNHSPFVTWVKGENSDRVYPVPPEVTYPWTIDGFADPINRPGEVYKVVDGLHTFYNFVDGWPAIDFTPDSQLSAITGLTIAQSLKGGWKDASWHAEIRANTDYAWDKLFEISRPNLAATS